MSNLLSLRNRNIKHYKNLSNHSVVDSETKDDLITELKNYRNSHSKPSSPYKLKTPTLKSQTLYSIDDTHEATTRFVRTTTNKQSKLRNYSKKTESVSLSLSENESLSLSKTLPELRNFVESIQFLSALKIDIELNSEVVKTKKIVSEKAAGLYFLLSDRLKSESSEITNTDDITKLLKEYCGVFRDVLRNLCDKNIDEEAVMIEML